MLLTVERFESDATEIHEGPIVQVSDDVVTLTFPEQEYASLTGFELLSRIRSEREFVDFGSGASA